MRRLIARYEMIIFAALDYTVAEGTRLGDDGDDHLNIS